MMDNTSRLRQAILAVSLLFSAALVQPVAHSQGTGPVVPARAELSPLDRPIAWLYEAKRNYTAVKDYSCTLVSQERVKGALQDKSTIELKMKTEPFSVYMRWLDPKKQQGQEVAFVAGKNNNKMRVKSNLLGLGLGGFMSIDPNDPRVLQHSRHTILEAGMGNMIEQNIKQWEIARKSAKTKVSIADFKYNNRDCIRVEVTALDRDASGYCFRSVIYLDKDSKLPIRLENYDWPRPGGAPAGELLEMFSYFNLQFNTGLKDADFKK